MRHGTSTGSDRGISCESDGRYDGDGSRVRRQAGVAVMVVGWALTFLAVAGFSRLVKTK